MKKKVLFVTAILLLIAGYFFNLTIALIRLNTSAEIYLYLCMICYALFYLLCWVLLLFAGLKRNSKRMLGLYQIFWFIAIVFFALLNLIPPHANILFEGIALLGWFVFGVPLIGFDAFLLYFIGSYPHFGVFYVALAVSCIMSLLGFLVRRKGVSKHATVG